ncbi:hypothetical protein BH11MYX4_BH11MYX4_08670 [soil metagenome]
MLRDFISENREEILARARLRVAGRSSPAASDVELTRGLPVFLDQLGEALLKASSSEAADHTAMKETASDHGDVLFDQGLTAEQVVHDYGDLCQVITGLAVEQKSDIPAQDFQTFNLCLDDAIAGAVTSYSARRERSLAAEDTERLGVLAHEMRNVLNVAMLAFASIRKGTVAPGGSTGAMLERNLLNLQTLVDRSMADVRRDAGLRNTERVAVWEIIEEVAIGASMLARIRGLTLVVPTVDHALVVDVDRQTLAAAISNLLQNALKFTHPASTISLATSTKGDRILIAVEDECGGLPAGQSASLLKPLTQKGADRSGLGLGPAICLKAMKVLGGELHIDDLPGKGCIFTIDLPKQPPPPTSIHAHHRKTGGGEPGQAGPSGQTARAVS